MLSQVWEDLEGGTTVAEREGERKGERGAEREGESHELAIEVETLCVAKWSCFLLLFDLPSSITFRENNFFNVMVS